VAALVFSEGRAAGVEGSCTGAGLGVLKTGGMADIIGEGVREACSATSNGSPGPGVFVEITSGLHPTPISRPNVSKTVYPFTAFSFVESSGSPKQKLKGIKISPGSFLSRPPVSGPQPEQAGIVICQLVTFFDRTIPIDTYLVKGLLVQSIENRRLTPPLQANVHPSCTGTAAVIAGWP
jgi:hypothetical protein